MNVPTGASALNAIERAKLPPLPPAIRSSAKIDLSARESPPIAESHVATQPAAVTESPTPVAPVEQAEVTTEAPAFNGESMFPPTAAEMAAMADAVAETKEAEPTKKQRPDLKPKGYETKRAISAVGKVIGALIVVGILVGGFFFWNRIQDTALVTQLDEGQCVTDFFSPAQGEFRNVFAVGTTDCAAPHAYEVFSVSETVFTDASESLGVNAAYPGIEETFAIGQEFCQAQYDEFVGGDFATSPWQVWTFVPTDQRWENSDRRVQCLVGDAAQANLVEGSLRDAGRAE